MDGAYHTGDDCPDDDGYRIELTIDHGGRIRQSFEDVGDDRYDDGSGYGGDQHTGSLDDSYRHGSVDDDTDVTDDYDDDNCADGPDPRYTSGQDDDCPPDVGDRRVTPVDTGPAPVRSTTPDLNDHPALAAINAQGTQDTLNTLDDEVDVLENRLGTPGGVPTPETALQGVQAPGGGLQTTSGMPLVTLGSGTEGSILSAALAPLPGGLDVKALVFDENGMLRPNAGVWAPSLAGLRGQDIDPALVDRFGSQLNDPDPIGFRQQDPDPSLIPPSER